MQTLDRAARNRDIGRLFLSGESMEQVSKLANISRERVRQLLNEAGIRTQGIRFVDRSRGCDITVVMHAIRYARSHWVTSISQVVDQFPISCTRFTRQCILLGINRALTRLFRARRRHDARQYILARLQAWANQHSRPPTQNELRPPLPWWPTIIYQFGSVANAYTQLGWTMRPKGYPGHLANNEL